MTPKLQHRLYVAHPEGGGDGSARKASGGGDGGGRHVSVGSEGGGPVLSRFTTACYSVGHFMNDATASCWFSYLLLYLQQARGLNGLESGIVLFSGQLFDALATPLVGIASDKSGGLRSLGLGRRKTWNFFGVVLVVAAFLFVFGFCLPCRIVGHDVSSAVKTGTFALFASLFNVGWAAVQVSHMAMVPELTHDEGERVMLNSARYAFTVLANVFVFLVMWCILRLYDGGNEDNKYSPEVYTLLTFVVLAAGGALSAMFLVGTREDLPVQDGYSPLTSTNVRNTAVAAAVDGAVDTVAIAPAPGAAPGPASATTPAPAPVRPGKAGSLNRVRSLGGDRPMHMTWRDWLRMPDFYKVAAVYMFARLATNVSQVYLTFFVTQTLYMDQTAIAIVPLIVYLSSLAATFVMKRLDKRLGRRNSMTLGGGLFTAASAAMMFIQPSAAGVVYAAAVALGAGSAISMVISVSMEADLVGRNVESAAFLYGAISLTDKLSNGVAVLGIQLLGDRISDEGERATFIRWVNGTVPAVAMALAVAVAWTIRFPSHLRGEGVKGRGRGERAGLLSDCTATATATTTTSGGTTTFQPPSGGFLARMRSFFRSDNRLDLLADGGSPLDAVDDDLSDHLLPSGDRVDGSAGGINGDGRAGAVSPGSDRPFAASDSGSVGLSLGSERGGSVTGSRRR